MDKTIDLVEKPANEKASAFYKKFFLFAACWNMGAGLLGVMSLAFNLKLFYNVANYSVDYLFKIHYYNFWLFIMTMGVGFYFVSKDISKNYAMAIVGILGKTLAAGTWIYYYFAGQATYMVLVASAGDMLLVSLFITFLTFTAKRDKNQKLYNQNSLR
jgi:hypothetical protein